MKKELVTFYESVRVFLDSQQSFLILGSKAREELRELLELIYSQYDMEQISISEEDKKKAQRASSILVSVLRENLIDDKAHNFIISYIHILYEWNNDILKNRNYTLRLKYIERYLKNKLTLGENINELDSNIGRLAHNLEKEPVVIEMSKHYFQLLEE